MRLLSEQGNKGDLEIVKQLWEDVSKLNLGLQFNKTSFAIKSDPGISKLLSLVTISVSGEIVYLHDDNMVKMFPEFTFETGTLWPRLSDIKKHYDKFLNALRSTAKLS